MGIKRLEQLRGGVKISVASVQERLSVLKSTIPQLHVELDMVRDGARQIQDLEEELTKIVATRKRLSDACVSDQFYLEDDDFRLTLEELSSCYDLNRWLTSAEGELNHLKSD